MIVYLEHMSSKAENLQSVWFVRISYVLICF